MTSARKFVVRVREGGGVLRVYAPFDLLELSRSLGGKWNKKEKSWDVAATVPPRARG